VVNNTLLYNRLPAVFLQKWLAYAIHLEAVFILINMISDMRIMVITVLTMFRRMVR